MDITERFLQQTVIFSLLVIEKINKQLLKTYKEDLTSSEFYALLSVYYFGDMKMTAFADNLGIKKQQATRVINDLVKKGYIQRIYDESDRRVVLISLTPEAKMYLNGYTAKTIGMVNDSLEGFNKSEIEELQNAIKTINRLLPKIKMA
ncbi:MAG: MarR family transcriptional regulator [Clostridiales bacterium]|nr:MarR family transcriptional regulator [Clostridiales bacterium]